MQPQHQVVVNAVHPQQPTLVVNANVLSEETLKMRKKTIFSLGKAELAIGCLMVMIGIFNAIYVPMSRSYRYITFGEGIWCGIWVIIAGGLGMGAGRINSTPCLINTHMAFSIVGSIASGTLFGLTVTWAIVASRIPFYCALMSIFSILSFATAILLIVSASYCCSANPRGCCGQAYPNGQYQQHVMYVNAPQVVPGQVQVPVATAGTYYAQGQVPQQPGSSNMSYGNPGPAPSTSLPEKSDAFPHHGEHPPAYQNQ